MRTVIFVALAIFAFVALAQADDETDEYRNRVMQGVGDVRKFFTDDPAGIKLKEICQETGAFVEQVRTKARVGLRQYIQNLLNEN